MSQTTGAAVTAGDGWDPESHPFDDGGQRQLCRGAVGESQAILGYAAGLTAAVEAEIRDLWRDTIGGGNRRLSDRLVELSQALRRAALVVEQDPVIGLSSLALRRPLPDPSSRV